MFERKGQPLLSRVGFLKRLLRSVLFVTMMIAVSLGLGMVGYHHFVRLGWLDAFLNASMILTGMGPVTPVTTDGGKLFAGLYAIFSGVVFLVMAGLMIAPIAHRVLHRFHVEMDEDSARGSDKGSRKDSAKGARKPGRSPTDTE